MNRKLYCILLTSLVFAQSMPVYSHEEETLFNVINLQAQAEREIPNDQMIVILAAEHEGSDAARISQEINKDMQWALDIIKTYKDINSKTGNYQTWPVYNKQTITGWRSSQQVEIKSENVAGLTELVGKLQENLQVKQMNFSPTDATRKRHENELIEEAMLAFRERVAIIGKHMDQKSHRIVNIHINTGGHFPPIMYERAALKTMAMDVAPPPAVEAGVSKITVDISGSVQFF
jgi:predicted secreted protein